MERNTALGRPKCRLEDNIKIDIKEIFQEGVDWIDLIQHRDEWRTVVNPVLKCLVP